MLRVLVTYASRYGSSRTIADEIAVTLRAQGMEANARPIREVTDLLAYDAVVVGGAVYGGVLHSDATAFIERHRAELSVIPLACFAVGARFGLRDEPEAARQREVVAAQVLARVSPLDLHCFAGSTTGFPLVMRALARMMRAPRGDLRDWPAIRAWAQSLAPRLSACASGAPRSTMSTPLTRSASAVHW